MDIAERVENDFTLHPPANAGISTEMDNCRAAFKNVALYVAQALPPGREQALALTKLEEACFFAIASIARSEENTGGN